MDLEQYPNSPRGKKMLGMVSPVYDKSLIAKSVYQVIGSELDVLTDFILTIPDQMYPETATWGIPYLEMAYSLPNNPRLTLQQRRERLKAEMTNKAPINPEKFITILGDAVGCECVFYENVEPYTQEIGLQTLPGMVDEDVLWRFINKMRQSHMLYRIVYEQGTRADLYAGGVIIQEREYTLRQAN